MWKHITHNDVFSLWVTMKTHHFASAALTVAFFFSLSYNVWPIVQVPNVIQNYMQWPKCPLHKLFPAFKQILMVSSSTFYNSIISCFDVIRMPQVPEGSEVQFHVLNEYLYTVSPSPGARSLSWLILCLVIPLALVCQHKFKKMFQDYLKSFSSFICWIFINLNIIWMRWKPWNLT